MMRDTHGNEPTEHVCCARCGKEYTKRRGWQRFCSEACRNQFNGSRRRRHGEEQLSRRLEDERRLADELVRMLVLAVRFQRAEIEALKDRLRQANRTAAVARESERRATYEAQRRARYLLGLKEGSSREEIEAAFRSKAKWAHPDCEGDEDVFIAIKEARDLLLGSG